MSIDLEFIEKAKELMKEGVKEAHENKKLHRRMIYEENQPRYREYAKKYESTEKGKEARERVTKKRYERFKEASANLTEEEFQNIEKFYDECPLGYHVDHIIPISLGGLHRLSNLQYLTAKENFKKATNEKWEKDDYSKIEYKSIRKGYVPRKRKES